VAGGAASRLSCFKRRARRRGPWREEVNEPAL
jgi:hypothetical protein